MSVTTLSNEGRLLDRLRQLDMNTTQLVRIAQEFDFPVSQALLSLVFTGKRELTAWTAQRLLELTDELVSLKDFYQSKDIPLNWGASGNIATLLVRRRMEQAAVDVDRDALAKGVPCGAQ